MKRKWNEIEKIKCRSTQIALMVCADQDVLVTLQKAFSHCFEEGEETVIGVWSHLLRKHERRMLDLRANACREYLCTNWMEDKRHFHLEFGRASGRPARDSLLPKEISEQVLAVQKIDGPIIIRYQAVEWIVAGAGYDNICVYCIENFHSIATCDSDCSYVLALVPKSHVILDV